MNRTFRFFPVLLPVLLGVAAPGGAQRSAPARSGGVIEAAPTMLTDGDAAWRITKLPSRPGRTSASLAPDVSWTAIRGGVPQRFLLGRLPGWSKERPGRYRLYDAGRGVPVRVELPSEIIGAVQISADEVALGYEGGDRLQVRTYSPAGRCIRHFTGGEAIPRADEEEPSWAMDVHGNRILFARGPRLFTLGLSGQVRTVRAGWGNPPRDERIGSFAIDRSGNRVAVGIDVRGQGTEVRWSGEGLVGIAGRRRHTILGLPSGLVQVIDFSPDGRYLLLEGNRAGVVPRGYVYDTRLRQLQVLTGARPSWAIFNPSWLDRTHVLAIGQPPVAIRAPQWLVCDVPSGRLSAAGSLVLPAGAQER